MGRFSVEVLFGKANRNVEVGAEVMRAPLTGDVPARVEMAGDITPSITLPGRGSVVGEIDRIPLSDIATLDDLATQLFVL